MLDWLEESLANGSDLPFEWLVVRLMVALVLGCVVAGVYLLTQRKPRPELTPFVTTLVLLTILLAMVTLVIGNSVARAFGLVGALSIVRFRTIVEDTRDTAFVIFAVVVGMAVGAGYPLVPLAGIPIIAAAAVLLGHWGRSGSPARVCDFSLSIRLGLGRDPDAVLREIFGKHLALARLRATTTARQGAALDITYHVCLRREEDAIAFVTELNRIEGVQNVELQRL
jgi:hypothetical protein